MSVALCSNTDTGWATCGLFSLNLCISESYRVELERPCLTLSRLSSVLLLLSGLHMSPCIFTLSLHTELFQFCLACSSGATCVPRLQSVEQTSIRTLNSGSDTVDRPLCRNTLPPPPPRPVGLTRELYTKHYRALVAESHCLVIKQCWLVMGLLFVPNDQSSHTFVFVCHFCNSPLVKCTIFNSKYTLYWDIWTRKHGLILFITKSVFFVLRRFRICLKRLIGGSLCMMNWKSGSFWAIFRYYTSILLKVLRKITRPVRVSSLQIKNRKRGLQSMKQEY